MDSGIAALIGALLGGGFTLFVNWIQQQHQTKREFLKIAYELAKVDYATAKDYTPKGGKIVPIEAYLAYYMEYAKIIQDKNFQIEDLEKIRSVQRKVMDFYQKEMEK